MTSSLVGDRTDRISIVIASESGGDEGDEGSGFQGHPTWARRFSGEPSEAPSGAYPAALSPTTLKRASLQYFAQPRQSPIPEWPILGLRICPIGPKIPLKGRSDVPILLYG